MATWDELQRAVRKGQHPLRTSTDADLDDFEAARGVKLPPSYREFAKLFGRCEMGSYIFATPLRGDPSESMVNLAYFDRELHGHAESDLMGIAGKVYMPNAEVGPRLVFFASDIGNYSYGFDPTEVTDEQAGESAIYCREDSRRGYVRVASTFPEFVTGFCYRDELETWREWSAAGGEADLKDEDDDDYDEDEDKRLFLQPM